MITLAASLLGFASSAVPEIFKSWHEKQDREHELAILDRQMEQARLGHVRRLEEISVDADVRESEALYKHDSQPSGVTWVDGLRASVRPIITYAFFTLFAAVKLCALIVLVFQEHQPLVMALPQVWDVETHALFTATITFWFGTRSLAKIQGR